MLIVLKIIFLFIAVWWTLINIARIIMKNNLPTMNLLLQAIGIVGFVVLQFNLI